MPKIKIRVAMESEENKTSYDIVGIYQEGKIKYRESEGAIAVFDYDKKHLTREDNQSRHEIDFKKGNINIYYKEINSSMDVKIRIVKIKENKKDIEITYEIGNEQKKGIFKYRIEERK